MNAYEVDDIWGVSHIMHIVGAEETEELSEMIYDGYFMEPYIKIGHGTFWLATDVIEWYNQLEHTKDAKKATEYVYQLLDNHCARNIVDKTIN